MGWWRVVVGAPAGAFQLRSRVPGIGDGDVDPSTRREPFRQRLERFERPWQVLKNPVTADPVDGVACDVVDACVGDEAGDTQRVEAPARDVDRDHIAADRPGGPTEAPVPGPEFQHAVGHAPGEQRQLDRFMQAYAVEKAKIESRRQGYAVTERPLADGSIKLVVQVPGGAA